MSFSGNARLLFLVVGLSLYSTLCCTAQSAHDCSRIITPEEKKGNGWTSFRNARVITVDLSKGILGIEIEGKHLAIYFNDRTEICNQGKPGTMRDVKKGDQVSGFTTR